MDVRSYRIEPAKAKEAIDAGMAVVLDLTSRFIRPAVKGQIPGAVSVSPVDVLDWNRPTAELVRSLPELSRDKSVIAYCTCPDEVATDRLTRILRQEGYDAWLLDGGLPAWRAAGYPMEMKAAA
ncbi:MAG TPA: rhodanese-like domain-containing protein [Candidatus Dormibacteraeota bacterium]|nr:rhodanese-like domain-containing protein [Candidatus Dormibacteraeota bacterium]